MLLVFNLIILGVAHMDTVTAIAGSTFIPTREVAGAEVFMLRLSNIQEKSGKLMLYAAGDRTAESLPYFLAPKLLVSLHY